MDRLSYVQVQTDNPDHLQVFERLMLLYFPELDAHRPNEPAIPTEKIKEYTRGMINRQGDHDRHLMLCYDREQLIGFFYAKVDHPGHLGFIKPEYGYIMEFYVLPEHRRKGYGTEMFRHIQTLFHAHGTQRMYLTADQVTGKPFWLAQGFEHLGEISPENGMKIYERACRKSEP